MSTIAATDRAALVQAARGTIAQGSQSFAAASRLFSLQVRERAWLLYAWCRAADDLTDGQEFGHGHSTNADPAQTQARLEALTAAALDGDDPLPVPFAALRQVAHETRLPPGFVADHLAGFALDAAGWRPVTEEDLLRYCYHVAGTVGCMMAVVMGVDPADDDTLDRACDLGLAFQLANIARDIVPDAEIGRCYLPAQWLAASGVPEAALADPARRGAVAALAERLVVLARAYRAAARLGAARLPFRSRLAVLSADAIYGSIGERVAALGTRAWDHRVRTSRLDKLGLFARALGGSLNAKRTGTRAGLWTRPRQGPGAPGSRS